MTLQDCLALSVKCVSRRLMLSRIVLSNLPCAGVPDPDAGVQTACSDSRTIECDGIDLAVVALQCVQASAFGDAPDFGCCIVTSRYNNISLDLQASDTSLMAHKNISAKASSNIPDSKGSIS